MSPQTRPFATHANLKFLNSNVRSTAVSRQHLPILAQFRDGERPPRQSRGNGPPNFKKSGPPSQRRQTPNKKEQEEIPVARIGPGQTATFFSSQKWSQCGADPTLIDALEAINIKRPSHIQAAAFQALSSTAPHVVLADHAGSGKTLAYLAPLVQTIKAEESILGRPGTIKNCPRVVIVVPTSELCAQVLRVCRALSSTLKFRAVAATGGRPIRTQKEALDQGIDILIGTPGRLSELLTSGALRLDNCAAIVCDEVDVLLGEASLFAEQVAPLKEACPDTTRWILVTATLPAETYNQLEPFFPGVVAALGPGLHRTAPGVTEQIVDCSGGSEINEESAIQRKSVALYASLQERRCSRVIVFCNKIETCRSVENFLNRTYKKEDNVTVLPYHTAIAPEVRERNLKTFLLPPGEEGGRKRRNLSTFGKSDGEGGSEGSFQQQERERLVLVCTDRASRGVDSAFVEHVVLFDFPRDPSEYVRRVGRTARGAGGQGLVTVLVLGRQVKLAQDVINRNQKGLPVHALPVVMAATGAAMQKDDAARFFEDLKMVSGGGNVNDDEEEDSSDEEL